MFEEEISASDDVKSFIQKLIDSYSGDLINDKISRNKPFQFGANLKVNIIDKMKKHKNVSFEGVDILSSLFEISLYVNSQDANDSTLFQNGYKQFDFPCYSKTYHELHFQNIELLLSECKNSALNTINILGGNVLKYSKLKELALLLHDFIGVKRYCFQYSDINIQNSFELKYINDGDSKMKIFIDFPVKKKLLKELVEILRSYSINYDFEFIVQSRDDLIELHKIKQEFNISQGLCRPFYNYKNLDFFKNHVFITEEILKEAKFERKSIFARSLINQHNFGHLTILPNNEAFGNVNHERLGKLGNDSLLNMLYNEIENGKSWLRVRKNVTPCRNCVYNCLCPSISNYEYAIGKCNLCHVWKDEK